MEKFTDNEIDQLCAMMQATWNTISYDLFADDDTRVMKRSEVVEVVLDADYLEMYGPNVYTDKAEKLKLVQRFRKLTYDQQKKIARGTFTYARYGA